MAWSKVNKALDWTGARIGETGDMLSDLTVSGSKQTSRGVVISHDSLKDTIEESYEKDVNRTRKRTKFLEKLSKDELAGLKPHEDYLKKILERN